MKATSEQQEFIDHLVAHLQHWKHSNDLSSPSHYTLNEETVDELIDSFNSVRTDTEARRILLNALDGILWVVRGIRKSGS